MNELLSSLQELLKNYGTMLLPLLTGALGVLALLPQPKKRVPIWVGVGLLMATLVLTVVGVVGQLPASTEGTRLDAIIEVALFYGFSFIAVVSGIILVTQTQPARAALSFTLLILATCGLFLLLAAPFLFAATIIVYAGAILVMFLFVLMLAQQTGLDDADMRSREPLLSVVTGFVLLGTLFFLIGEHRKTDTARAELRDKSPAMELARLAEKSAEAASATDIEQLKKIAESAAVKEGEDTIGLPRGMSRKIDALRPPLVDPYTKEMARVVSDLENLSNQWGDVVAPEAAVPLKQRQTILREFEAIGDRALAIARRNRQEESPRRLSTFSGPVGVGPEEIRRGSDGRPAMPAENSAALGKSLFTDYLLPVELGGLLLLVAVIGAILIGQRHDEHGKETA